MASYTHPPITEAVVEFRLRSLVDLSVVDRVHNKLRKQFAKSEPINEVSLAFNVARKDSNLSVDTQGYKLTSEEGTDVFLIKRNGLAFSRLAPYPGWDSFAASALESWALWASTTKARDLERVGMRYINRIDVPRAPETKIELDDYFRVFINLPDDGVIQAYALQAQLETELPDCTLAIRSGSAPDTIVDHYSFLIDIDLGCIAVPSTDADLSDLLGRMRREKNRVFESYITDKCRALFAR